jgi:cysteine-rich repeat protein
LEVFTPQVGQCNEDLVIDLTAPDLVTRLAFDDDDGLGFCSLISPELDLGARRLPAGTYIARVADFQGNQIIDSYRLLLSVEALCGDGVVEGFETCDDGNLENGDQCSASCH